MLALDVFKEMNEKDCTPNLVTYNILIDVTARPAAPPTCPRLQYVEFS